MAEQGSGRHSILEMGNLLMLEERERFLVKLFNQRGITNLESTRIFEAGCAGGYNLRLMVQWGARPENIVGMDLDPQAVDYCRSRASQIVIHQGSAETIPEPDQSFDISLAFTLFSSVPEPAIAQAIADELVRITRPGGLILVYDMRRRSPRNKAVHPISPADVRRWFQPHPVRTKSITLAPPLARNVAGRLPAMYGLLASVPLLRTHAVHVVRRAVVLP